MSGPTDYEKYIRTSELLDLQKKPEELSCHDELTFQTVHQIAELHFKLIIADLEQARTGMEAGQVLEPLSLLRRMNYHLGQLPKVFKTLEYMRPDQYHIIRRALGQGSGQDSPGFNTILRQGPTLWEPFRGLFAERDTTVFALYEDPTAHYPLFLLAQELFSFDENFQSFRYEHVHLVERQIGLETSSLKGLPAKILKKGVEDRFYPRLWQVISELTDHTGSSYNPKPLD